MAKMKMSEIDNLYDLHGLATAGRWSWEDNPATLYAGRGNNFHGLNLLGKMTPDGNGNCNLNLICEMKNQLIKMLDDGERLISTEARINQLIQKLEDPDYGKDGSLRGEIARDLLKILAF